MVSPVEKLNLSQLSTLFGDYREKNLLEKIAIVYQMSFILF